MRQWRKQTRCDVDKEGHLCCVEASVLQEVHDTAHPETRGWG